MPKVHEIWTEDATGFYFNDALKLPWGKPPGDWLDVDGLSNGPKPFGVASSVEGKGLYEVDVTDYVRVHGGDFHLQGRDCRFASREATSGQPILSITLGTSTTDLLAEADATMGMQVAGQGKALDVGLSRAYIRFDQAPNLDITKAILRLNIVVFWSTQPATATKIFRPVPNIILSKPSILADGKAEDVVLHLKGPTWISSPGGGGVDPATILPDGSRLCTIPTGGEYGADTIYVIPPDERVTTMFARFSMTLNEDFKPTVGGKFPGLCHTGQGDKLPDAMRAGWGSRVANGKCWSCRTKFFEHVPSNPFSKEWNGASPYAYRVNKSTSFGEGPSFKLPLPVGSKFTLDQMVKLNSIVAGVAQADGEVIYWVDGVPVCHFKEIIFRTSDGPDTLPSEFWLNLYVGGTGYKAPHPHSVIFHEAIISRKLMPLTTEPAPNPLEDRLLALEEARIKLTTSVDSLVAGAGAAAGMILALATRVESLEKSALSLPLSVTLTKGQ